MSAIVLPVTVAGTACSGDDPPTCCQPHPIPPAFLSTRAYLASLPPGAMPDRCPHCASRAVAPLFWPDASLELYECFAPACRAIWCWRD